jgi:hypothetical protein
MAEYDVVVVVGGAGEEYCENELIEGLRLRESGSELGLELARLQESWSRYRGRVAVGAELGDVMIEGSMIVDGDGTGTVGRLLLRGTEEIGCCKLPHYYFREH